MYRKLIPLAVAIVFAVGCGKKPKESDSGGGSGGGGSRGDGGGAGGGGAPAPRATTFTITIREEQKGDKFVVAETKSSTLSVKENTPNGPVAQSQKSIEKTEYTET